MTVERTRSRFKVTAPAINASYDRWLGSGAYWYGNTSVSTPFGSRQITVDEVHAWPRRKADSRRDIGGPFRTTKSALEADWDLDRIYTFGSQGTFERYVGPVRPNIVPQDWEYLYEATPTSKLLFWADSHPAGYLEGLGAKAIASTIPTNPHADAAVGVAELFREGLPSLVGGSLLRDRIGFFKSLGGEYLNIEFGWKPLIGDILDLCQSISDSEEILTQLARDSGRNVRRRLGFPVERDTVYTTDSLYLVGPSTTLSPQRGRSNVRATYHKTWFSGCYTYHYDPAALSEASRIATQARHLLGLRIDPNVLWNLAPWSWLVDWFVNIGPVLHNLSAFGQDGLVLRYGYLMHHHTRRDTYTHHGVRAPKGSNFPTGDVSYTFRLEDKRRIRATPYGFGLTFSSFTARQLAILGALGITRTPGLP